MAKARAKTELAKQNTIMRKHFFRRKLEVIAVDDIDSQPTNQ